MNLSKRQREVLQKMANGKMIFSNAGGFHEPANPAHFFDGEIVNNRTLQVLLDAGLIDAEPDGGVFSTLACHAITETGREALS